MPWSWNDKCKCSHPRNGHHLESSTDGATPFIKALKTRKLDQVGRCLVGLSYISKYYEPGSGGKRKDGHYVDVEITPFPAANGEACDCTAFELADTAAVG